MPHSFVCLTRGACAILVFIFSASMAANAGDDQINALKAAYARPNDIPTPRHNPLTPEKIALGRDLFFDRSLSADNTMSCATCHDPDHGWEEPVAFSKGVSGHPVGRHTPTIQNLAWSATFFWDGRARSLEEQALGPIEAEGEMNQSMPALLAELSNRSDYQAAFEAAFPGEGISPKNIAKAIASYERTIVSAPSAFDEWINGDEAALSDAAKRGFLAFNTTAGCANCHKGWNFTDDSFHDIGLPNNGDLGRYDVIPIDELKHGFKTPGLRNLGARAPFMHDGSITTLDDVLEHYASGMVARPSLSSAAKPFDMDAAMKADLIAFLKSLDSPTSR